MFWLPQQPGTILKGYAWRGCALSAPASLLITTFPSPTVSCVISFLDFHCTLSFLRLTHGPCFLDINSLDSPNSNLPFEKTPYTCSILPNASGLTGRAVKIYTISTLVCSGHRRIGNIFFFIPNFLVPVPLQ